MRYYTSKGLPCGGPLKPVIIVKYLIMDPANFTQDEDDDDSILMLNILIPLLPDFSLS